MNRKIRRENSIRLALVSAFLSTLAGICILVAVLSSPQFASLPPYEWLSVLMFGVCLTGVLPGYWVGATQLVKVAETRIGNVKRISREDLPPARGDELVVHLNELVKLITPPRITVSDLRMPLLATVGLAMIGVPFGTFMIEAFEGRILASPVILLSMVSGAMALRLRAALEGME